MPIQTVAPTAARAAPEECEALAANPKRQQILNGARAMFLAHGFEATSMQDVARAAKVSKGTLYVYFDSKEAMFESLVLSECDRMQQAIRQLGSGSGEIGDELRRISRHLIDSLLHADVLAAMRMMIGAGEKFPELARHLYATGPMRSVETLTAYLNRRAAQGELQLTDSHEAASEFFDLILVGLQRKALLMMPPPSSSQIDAFIARRVERFLSAHRPPPQPTAI